MLRFSDDLFVSSKRVGTNQVGSVGFAREICCLTMSDNNLICFHLVGKAHATRCGNSNLFLPPSGGGKLGWGWFCGFRVKANSYSPKSRPLPSPLPPDGRGGRFQVKTRSSENLEIRVCRETRSTPVFRRPFSHPVPASAFPPVKSPRKSVQFHVYF